jgi:hypothetical protein
MPPFAAHAEGIKGILHLGVFAAKALPNVGFTGN